MSGVSENQKYRKKNAYAVPLICNPLKDQVFDIERHCFEHLKGFKFVIALMGGGHGTEVLIARRVYWEVFTGGRTGMAKGENGPVGFGTKVG